MNNVWRDEDAGEGDLEQLVYLSNIIGADPTLVQPGGGNTSVKVEEADALGCETRALVVKGSGTDLRTIDGSGFTHLYIDKLALLRRQSSMSDEEMMGFMRACMLEVDRDPLPSVETPLHALIPARFIAHTHDVATLSLTDTPNAEEHVSRLYGSEAAFLEYVRPGFPLAHRLAERYARGQPEGAVALVMEKHGLAVWGGSAKECYANLRLVIGKAEESVRDQARGKRVFGPATSPTLGEQQRLALAASLLPVIRGELIEGGWRPVLHFDGSKETLDIINSERFTEVASRGVMTPEHILRAGRKPLLIELDLKKPVEELKDDVRQAMDEFRRAYIEYAEAQGQTNTIPDFLKVVVIPGLGVAYAGNNKRGAVVAADCYRATIWAMEGAEAVESFEFLSDSDACEMEYWPLERRKVEERAKAGGDLEGRVAVVIGGASGIGRATAHRFAEEGAHVAVVDVDGEAAHGVESKIGEKSPGRVMAIAANASDAGQVESAFRETILQFGGVDVLFYSPGVGPQFHSVVDVPEDEIEEKMAVHYRGAVAATRAASRAMLDQGSGGRLVYNASKAAFAPGEGFAAYGVSKAALVHYVRNVANELGRHGITANYINADAIDTPMFRDVLRQRAERAGKSEEEMLKSYEERSIMRKATVPAEAVAEAALFLASDRSAYTTGCVITVGGGHEGFPR